MLDARNTQTTVMATLPATSRRDPAVLKPDRQYAAGRVDATGHRPLPPVRQTGESEPRRLDQGPHRAGDDRLPPSRTARLKPGGTVVEATAGNTGLGLALVARAKGYRVVLVIPDKMSTRKGAAPQGARRRDPDDPLRRQQGTSGVLPGHGGAHWLRDIARRVLRQPVRQSGQSDGARAHDRPRDLGADAASRRRGRLRRGLGWHADRPVALFRARQPRHRNGARRSGRLGARPTMWKPGRSAPPARGWSRASARTSSRRSPTFRE